MFGNLFERHPGVVHIHGCRNLVRRELFVERLTLGKEVVTTPLAFVPLLLVLPAIADDFARGRAVRRRALYRVDLLGFNLNHDAPPCDSVALALLGKNRADGGVNDAVQFRRKHRQFRSGLANW